MQPNTTYAIAEHIREHEGLGPAHEFIAGRADAEFVGDRIESLLFLDCEDDGADGTTDLAAGIIESVDRLDENGSFSQIRVAVGGKAFIVSIEEVD